MELRRNRKKYIQSNRYWHNDNKIDVQDDFFEGLLLQRLETFLYSLLFGQIVSLISFSVSFVMLYATDQAQYLPFYLHKNIWLTLFVTFRGNLIIARLPISCSISKINLNIGIEFTWLKFSCFIFKDLFNWSALIIAKFVISFGVIFSCPISRSNKLLNKKIGLKCNANKKNKIKLLKNSFERRPF